ncbi:hypothetical protein CFB39_19680 [Burkholderia sp. AU6039]|nr:hypothetical protein CFB39_19680 [Burkholderia sp. AU6039]
MARVSAVAGAAAGRLVDIGAEPKFSDGIDVCGGEFRPRFLLIQVRTIDDCSPLVSIRHQPFDRLPVDDRLAPRNVVEALIRFRALPSRFELLQFFQIHMPPVKTAHASFQYPFT